MIIYFLLIFTYRFSVYIGNSRAECGAAITAICVSWVVSVLPQIFIVRRKIETYMVFFFAGSFLRLVVLSVLIFLMLKNWNLRQNVLLLWTGGLYFVFLAVDSYFKVRYVKSRDWQQQDMFENKRDEIYFNNTKSARGNRH